MISIPQHIAMSYATPREIQLRLSGPATSRLSTCMFAALSYVKVVSSCTLSACEARRSLLPYTPGLLTYLPLTYSLQLLCSPKQAKFAHLLPPHLERGCGARRLGRKLPRSKEACRCHCDSARNTRARVMNSHPLAHCDKLRPRANFSCVSWGQPPAACARGEVARCRGRSMAVWGCK